jgi:hypothetical protein
LGADPSDSRSISASREVSNWAVIAVVSGLSRVMVSRPITKAAMAAGMMKRQAETPAARMAISSLRRFSSTKAPRVPNRKMNGVSTRIVAGACRMVRYSSWGSRRRPGCRRCGDVDEGDQHDHRAQHGQGGRQAAHGLRLST